jgi:hypothetical protein
MTSLFLLFNADSFHMFALLLAGWLDGKSITNRRRLCLCRDPTGWIVRFW